MQVNSAKTKNALYKFLRDQTLDTPREKLPSPVRGWPPGVNPEIFGRLPQGTLRPKSRMMINQAQKKSDYYWPTIVNQQRAPKFHVIKNY